MAKIRKSACVTLGIFMFKIALGHIQLSEYTANRCYLSRWAKPNINVYRTVACYEV